MKETYASIQGLLEKIFYRDNQWNMCRPESCVIGGKAAKFCCLPCEWDCQAMDRHYHVKQWPLQGEMIVGEKNIAHQALADNVKVCIPPLHIKLGFIKIFVNTKDLSI
jgi:hypothetical protein